MKTLSFIMLYIGIFTSLHAQTCPGGATWLKIDLPNRDSLYKEILGYEILAVTDTIFRHIVQDRVTNSDSTAEIGKLLWKIQTQGTLLSNKEAIQLMPIIRRENESKSETMLAALARIKGMEHGAIPERALFFKTRGWENNGMYVLQIMTNTRIIYILLDIFGGCIKTNHLRLGDTPILFYRNGYISEPSTIQCD